MIIPDYRLDAIHTFQVRTLKELGFETRVALNNQSQANPKYATNYRVDLSVFGTSGRLEKKAEGIARIAPGQRCVIDAKSVAPDAEGILIFHLIPERLRPQAQNGKLAIEKEELAFLAFAQGQYVEYYRPDGYASGVLYQHGAFNYDRASKEVTTTLIQAPKILVSNEVQTYVSLIHTSFTEGYDKVARLRCALVDGMGQIVASWTETVPPFHTLLVDFTARVRDHLGAQGNGLAFYGFYGLCEDATLIPLTFHHNRIAGTLAVEHSLPPAYYASNLVGKIRAQTVQALAASKIFSTMTGDP